MSNTKDVIVITSDVPAEREFEALPHAGIIQAGSPSRNAWQDFFGTVQNDYTRAAYEHRSRFEQPAGSRPVRSLSNISS
jgi:hypothetical protein